MKNKVITLNLFLVLIILAGIIGGVIWFVYNDKDMEDVVEFIQSGDITVFVEDVTTTTDENTTESYLTETNVSTNSNTVATTTTVDDDDSVINDFYYNQLNDTQKALYDGLTENKENMQSGTYKIDFGDQFTSILEQDDGTETLGDDYQSAIDAFIHDNSDLFYLDVSKLNLYVETTKKVFSITYNVYIAPKEGETYLNSAFSSESDVKEALEKLESVKSMVLSNLTDNDYDNIKMIHDYLVDNIEYDKYYESVDSYSIYGALIDGKAVCEGYAKAFKYLANAAGIKCELVQGTAVNSDGDSESHAWNCVYLEGNWYYIDSTWDDPIVVGNGVLAASYRYKYFLKGSDTFDRDHIASNQFVEDGKEFYYPNVSKSDY